MTRSPLVNISIPAHSGNYIKGRTSRICKITPHHMAGNLTVETCGSIFQQIGRYASSNYGIGSDGRIACYVDEENRPYTSSSAANDNAAITIEVANNGGAPSWTITEKAFASLVSICVDICKRHGFRMSYDSTPNGSLTRHNMFVSTACPGPYLQGRFPELVTTVNKLLDGAVATDNVNLLYRAHIQNKGDLPEVRDGQTAGTTGQSLRLEELTINTSKLKVSGDLVIGAIAHIANIGWTSTKQSKDGRLVIGTRGQGLRMEAIGFWIIKNTTGKRLEFRIHSEYYGWSGWQVVSDIPFPLGSTGQSRRLEAVQVRLI